jgi:hypothetical protein
MLLPDSVSLVQAMRVMMRIFLSSIALFVIFAQGCVWASDPVCSSEIFLSSGKKVVCDLPMEKLVLYRSIDLNKKDRPGFVTKMVEYRLVKEMWEKTLESVGLWIVSYQDNALLVKKRRNHDGVQELPFGADSKKRGCAREATVQMPGMRRPFCRRRCEDERQDRGVESALRGALLVGQRVLQHAREDFRAQPLADIPLDTRGGIAYGRTGDRWRNHADRVKKRNFGSSKPLIAAAGG